MAEHQKMWLRQKICLQLCRNSLAGKYATLMAAKNQAIGAHDGFFYEKLNI